MDWKTITPAREKALRWIAQNEPVGLSPAGGGATLRMTKRLRTMGLVEECGREPGGIFSVTQFRLTEAGRRALGME